MTVNDDLAVPEGKRLDNEARLALDRGDTDGASQNWAALLNTESLWADLPGYAPQAVAWNLALTYFDTDSPDLAKIQTTLRSHGLDSAEKIVALVGNLPSQQDVSLEMAEFIFPPGD